MGTGELCYVNTFESSLIHCETQEKQISRADNYSLHTRMYRTFNSITSPLLNRKAKMHSRRTQNAINQNENELD